MNYQKFRQAEQYFESLSNLTDENFFVGKVNPEYLLKRAKLLLKLAGHPDQAYKIIHIAGTSGKGSTVNYIAQILQNAGYKVGAHYSPFISVATEKIQIDGRLISAQDFIDLVEQMKPIIKKCYEQFLVPSYFECWMVAALLYFKKQKVDFVVLETGCGGRFDASNAIKSSLIQIITNIGLDHTFILGDTIKKIAYEKAGIIRNQGTVITAARKPDALKIIQKVAEEKNADLITIKTDDNPNKAIASQVGQLLNIKNSIIEKSLRQVKIPARFEIIQKKPTVIIDGAHNQDKIQFLTKKLQAFINTKKIKPRLHLICALTDKKKPAEVFALIKKITHQVYATRFLNPFRKCSQPKDLQRFFKDKPTQLFLDPKKALDAALKKAKPTDIILITGSFFLCSDLRKIWITEEWQLDNRKNFKEK